MAISVLLVDDDPDLSIMLRTLLRGQDFQIRAVFNGEDGHPLVLGRPAPDPVSTGCPGQRGARPGCRRR
jgi:DNA-binding response OmpR family regulator